VRLNCIGTIEDLARQQIVLRDGVRLTLYSEELAVKSVVEYSPDEHLWVAVIDWHAIKDIGPQAIGTQGSTPQQSHIAGLALPRSLDPPEFIKY